MTKFLTPYEKAELRSARATHGQLEVSGPKSKPKATKPILAWALLSPVGELLPSWCSQSREFLLRYKTSWQLIVRVEIRPVPKPRKARRSRKK